MNGNPNPDLAQMTDQNGHLYLSKDEARQLGFNDDYLKTVPTNVPLDGYPGVKVNYSRADQSVSITAPFSALKLSTEVLGQGKGATTHATASPGVLLNYDLYSTHTLDQGTGVSGFSELRAFSDWGVASTNYLTQAVNTQGVPGWTRTTTRLDTDLEHSFQDKQITLRLGDELTRGLSWTRQTRIGGIQIGRNFSLQPYQTTAPLPAYFGTAALPSSVQLYVNGIQQYSGKTPAGPFNLNFQPSVTGAGQAQVVMTDALGRSTVVNFPFYTTSTMLREGLSDWSFEAGYVRQNYGYQSFDYSSEPMASGVLRYGLKRWLTLEGHAEGSRGIGMAGVGATTALGTWGTLSGSWAASRASALSMTSLGLSSGLVPVSPQPAATGMLQGSQYSLGYQLQHNNYSIGMNTQRASANFRDVASAYGSVPTLRSDSVYANMTVKSLGNFGVTYVRLDQPDQPSSRYGGLSWSRGLTHGATIGVSYNQNLDNPADRTVTLNLTFNFDHGLSSYASSTRSQNSLNNTLGVSGNTGKNGDGWNWNLRGQQSSPYGDQAVSTPPSGSGALSGRTQYADINLGASMQGSTSSVYAGASGALVAMGGGIFATRRIDDAFAVVSTDGVPDIPVRNENRPVGETNSRGLLLVPSLLSYQNNKISIDPTKLPLNMHIDKVQANVVPKHASGVKVVFGMHEVHAASLTLHQPDGKPVPLGTPAYLNDSTHPNGWVGYDGQLYLEGLQPKNMINLKDDSYHCTVKFPFKAAPDSIPEIGPLVCTP